MMQLYQYDKAPKWMQDLSTSGGDEDWILFIPSSENLTFNMLPFDRSQFGCCDVQEHRVSGIGIEGIIYIGNHA